MRTKDYHEAYRYAVLLARNVGVHYGIEKMHDPFVGGHIYSVKMVSRPEHRFGWQLHCEIVTPKSPLHPKEQEESTAEDIEALQEFRQD